MYDDDACTLIESLTDDEIRALPRFVIDWLYATVKRRVAELRDEIELLRDEHEEIAAMNRLLAAVTDRLEALGTHAEAA